MDKFNSLFELFAAFNFAYVFSADLIKNFNEKLGGNFFKAEESISKIDLTIQNINSYITESFKEGAHNSVIINTLLAEFKLEQDKYISDRDSTKDQIKNSLEKSKFNYLCLFSGLYSILILLFAGFEIIDLTKVDHVEYLFWFNLSVLISLLILMSDFLHIWETNHVTTTITFCATIIISLIIIAICSSNNFHWSPFFTEVVVLFSILIACWHFFMYFIKIYINQKRKGTELISKTSKWDDKFKDINTRLSVAINVSSENKKTIIKPKQKKTSPPAE